MKRIALILILSAAAVALYASVDFDLAIGQKTGASLEFEDKGSGLKPQFLFNVDAELDMDFGKGHGMLVSVNPFSESGSVEFALGAGYAYQDTISNSTSFIVGVGPSFIFSSNGVGFALFATIDFDFHLTQSMFIRVGTGIELGFGEFGSSEFGKKSMTINIPLPAIGLGWNF